MEYYVFRSHQSTELCSLAYLDSKFSAIRKARTEAHDDQRLGLGSCGALAQRVNLHRYEYVSNVFFFVCFFFYCFFLLFSWLGPRRKRLNHLKWLEEKKALKAARREKLARDKASRLATKIAASARLNHAVTRVLRPYVLTRRQSRAAVLPRIIY